MIKTINSAKYTFAIFIETKQNKTFIQSTQTHLFNVIGVTAFRYKASPAVAQYLLMQVLKQFQCCLNWNGVLF